MKIGTVLEYAYLWKRQADAGEISGRKDRPVCLALRLGTDPDRMAFFLFPITSQPPAADRPAIAIPQIECRRGGLSHPAWLIVDEFNHTKADAAYDVADATPRGMFSAAFMKAVVRQIAEARQKGRLQGVKR